MSTRAHTVPRFYLTGFVAPESKSGRDTFVYLGSLDTGEIKKRSPKNISISRGLYDGPGGFLEPSASIEAHLSKIERAAASAIRKLAARPCQAGGVVSAEVWRFLAWQAARTPGWMDLESGWAQEWDPGAPFDAVEPPPDGIERVRDRSRTMSIEYPPTGERREVTDFDEFKALIARGWKWVLQSDDHLELLHMQAWYFQVRHFPRLSWVRLDAPQGESFVTSDRAVTWVADGFADAPPAVLRHPTAHVFAPLTSNIALVGRRTTERLGVTPREINCMIASTASTWVAGPTEEVVRQAIADRLA